MLFCWNQSRVSSPQSVALCVFLTQYVSSWCPVYQVQYSRVSCCHHSSVNVWAQCKQDELREGDHDITTERSTTLYLTDSGWQLDISSRQLAEHWGEPIYLKRQKATIKKPTDDLDWSNKEVRLLTCCRGVGDKWHLRGLCRHIPLPLPSFRYHTRAEEWCCVKTTY